MDYFTKPSLLEKIANLTGLNNKFHKFQKDNINLDKSIFISPVEAEIKYVGKIIEGRLISKNNKIVSLKELIEDSKNFFINGFYINLYLSPKNKHYWRIPYDSEVISTKINKGITKFPIIVGLENLFPKLDLFDKLIQKNASIGSIFKTQKFIYSMIAVGSLNVNGVHTINKNYFKKGEIGGYFNIGSSMLLCFQEYPFNILKNIGDKINIGDSLLKIKDN
ncbi:MAG: phosphatidylserine decarboxylase [Candidatus Pacearchaeota archaeon]|jgi:phosphatidylserine decarboxylase